MSPRPPFRRRAARWLRRDGGTVALETVIVGPALLILIFMSVQAGLFFYGRAVAIQAAREGVSQFRLAHDQATADDIKPDVEAHVETFAASVGRGSLDGATAEATYDDERGRVQVSVTGTTLTLVPGLHLRTTQHAVGRIERFQEPQ